MINFLANVAILILGYFVYDTIINSVHTLVLQIIDGKFETVWPPEVVSTQLTLPRVD